MVIGDAVDWEATMKLIGIEEHYLTAALSGAWEAIGLAASDPGFGFHLGEVDRRPHIRDRSGTPC